MVEYRPDPSWATVSTCVAAVELGVEAEAVVSAIPPPVSAAAAVAATSFFLVRRIGGGPPGVWRSRVSPLRSAGHPNRLLQGVAKSSRSSRYATARVHSRTHPPERARLSRGNIPSQTGIVAAPRRLVRA